MRSLLILIGVAGLAGLVVGIVTSSWIATWAVTTAGLALVAADRAARRPVVMPKAVVVSDGTRALELEIARARRYGRPLTVLRIQPDPADPIAVEDVIGACREVDVAWADDGIWLAAADTDVTARAGLVARLARTFPAVATGDRIHALTFPDDAMTMHALLEQFGAAQARTTRAADAIDALTGDPLSGQARGGV
jgi:hypothetical protein